ncbi:MAG TPA: DUF362 domain-containing protein, partial [Spirochaetota bacterium]
MRNVRLCIIACMLCVAIFYTGCTARGIGNNVDAVYPLSVPKRTVDERTPLSPVALSCMDHEPSDDDVRSMTDDALRQVLGAKGLTGLIKPGDRVVIKVNMVGPGHGLPAEKGLGIITDPRIVRYVAGKVREIIGFGGTADLKVIDALFYGGKNPSDPSERTSFHYARLERNGNGNVDDGDICYDLDADGYLDGSSRAQLVNLDSIDSADRFCTTVDEPVLGKTEVWLPKFLRTKEQAHGESEYCDLYIGMPVLKSHAFTGVTGALKLHYGLSPGVYTRTRHAGYGWGTGDVRLLLDYLCAINRV